MKKLIIIPAYNEKESIRETVKEICEKAEDYDYLVVNDCSRDGTKDILETYHLHHVSLCNNLGIGGAVQTGYRYARDHGYDLAVQVDGDGQHDPGFLAQMESCMENERADMVIGSRFLEGKGFQSSGLRRVGIRYFTSLIRLLTGQNITDPTSGMRMVNRRIIELFAEEYPDDYPEPESVTALLLSGGKVVEMPVLMRERSGGVSSISPLKSVYYMIKVTMAILMARLRGKEGL